MTRGHGQRENDKRVLKLFIVFVCITSVECGIDLNDRAKINMLEEESAMAVGGKITLSPAEMLANYKLMKLKYAEIEHGIDDPYHFNFSKHYFEYQHDIHKSKVYQIIRKMPKGAALHVHASMMMGSDYIVQLTYIDNLYVCFINDTIKLLFSESVPQRPCSSKWELMSDVRNASTNVELFDERLKKHFTMYTEDHRLLEADIDTTWKRFDQMYYAIRPLLAYRPVREKYFYDALKKFYDDNIMYVEIRSGSHKLYDLNGTIDDPLELAKLYDRVATKFTKDYPDFIGVKMIYTKHRKMDLNKLRESMEIARKLKSLLPDLFIGLDLVGQEDLGKPLSDFLPTLSKAKDEFDYYFHAGETNWLGTPTDENLMDAILLGSKRLGHAYALIKHPSLIQTVKSKNIALEINVISNVVLSLVRDVRNHPLASYLALGLPVVLSSDDPGAWDAEPLSHDFYVSFVGVASKRADLRTLKQLALNSIQYSALDEFEKSKALELFEIKWEKFIHEVNLMNT